jgi:hypothetical protein
MKFFEDVGEVWRESSSLARVVIVVTFPFWLFAAWLAYVFDTNVD